MQPKYFMEMVGRTDLPAMVKSPCCEAELKEGSGRFVCQRCGEPWPMSKIDELRTDANEFHAATLRKYIEIARAGDTPLEQSLMAADKAIDASFGRELYAGETDLETALVDLFADLMHKAKVSGFDLDHILSTAREHFEEEDTAWADLQGTEGQDRESYTDTQDRESYKG
jgi:hypothetical protein